MEFSYQSFLLFSTPDVNLEGIVRQVVCVSENPSFIDCSLSIATDCRPLLTAGGGAAKDQQQLRFGISFLFGATDVAVMSGFGEFFFSVFTFKLTFSIIGVLEAAYSLLFIPLLSCRYAGHTACRALLRGSQRGHSHPDMIAAPLPHKQHIPTSSTCCVLHSDFPCPLLWSISWGATDSLPCPPSSSHTCPQNCLQEIHWVHSSCCDMSKGLQWKKLCHLTWR